MAGSSELRDDDQVAYQVVTSPCLDEDGADHLFMNESNITTHANIIPVSALLYSSVALVLLQAMQFGWSISQLNLSTFHDQDACDARPVAPGTCLMFSGHTSGDWTWVVNLWVVGGMIGSLGCARVSDHFGRMKSLMANAVIMIIGAAIQATAQGVAMFAIGRFVAGLASGTSTALANGYINEISPPRLRNRLGICFQLAVGLGIILVGTSFFYANTSSGWRYIGGFPIVLGSAFLLGSPRFMVESPVWLLNQGLQKEAEQEIARLFGSENVSLALSWIEAAAPESVLTVKTKLSHDESAQEIPECKTQMLPTSPWKELFSPTYRRQTLVAVMLAVTQQLSGINAVFFYSSSTFQDAGLHDDRIGSVIVSLVHLLPTFFAGALGMRFGNRRMIIIGHLIMFAAAVGITVALVIESPVLSIVFTAVYVAGFAVSLGPLVFVVITSVFPNSLRASGTSICLFANWCGTLLIGIGYPHVADALDEWGFLPFFITLSGFGLFMVKFLPETAGKTGDEIQAMFRSHSKASEYRC